MISVKTTAKTERQRPWVNPGRCHVVSLCPMSQKNLQCCRYLPSPDTNSSLESLPSAVGEVQKFIDIKLLILSMCHNNL